MIDKVHAAVAVGDCEAGQVANVLVDQLPARQGQRKRVREREDVLGESARHGSVAVKLGTDLTHEAAVLREALRQVRPEALESLQLQAGTVPSVASLRAKADALRAQIAESSHTFEQHIGATPLTAVAMSSDCNPLHDLSAVADYASKASPRAAMTG